MDVSKCGDGVGSATVSPNKTWSTHLSDESSVFTAKLQAIHTALAARITDTSGTFVICLDSRSAVHSVCDAFSEHPMIPEIRRWLSLLQDMGKSGRFCWFLDASATVVLRGMKEQTLLPGLPLILHCYIPPIMLPFRDYYPIFHRVVKETWKHSWLHLTTNKLRKLKDSVDPWPTSSRVNRLEEVVLACLRIGHTKHTHSHLMSEDPAPFCEGCLVPLAVVHILRECPEYSNRRRRAFGITDGIRSAIVLTDIIKDDSSHVESLLLFLRVFPDALFVAQHHCDW